jgi:LmbE family N-acetylglucosaminyl deacetylase
VILPDTEYSGEDLQREISRVLAEFRPTLLALPHPADQHPDHCATYFFVQAALKEHRKNVPVLHPHLLLFLIHFGQWPLDAGAGGGSRLHPPRDFPEKESLWLSFLLSAEEAEAKRKALLQYHSQMLAMGRYLLSFARGNELFVLDRPTTEEVQEQEQCCGTEDRGARTTR